MQTTTNYGFSIAEGSDSVNLLTQLYPNFTSLDGILLPIQNNGTTPATHTKAGTVHQLVRTTTGCSVLRFVATGNYNAGDTFTVDGASVTATSCNGQSLPAGAFVINQSVMCILNGAVLTVLAGGSSISDASDVTYDNAVSGLTATNVQDAIDEIKSDIPTSFSAGSVTYDNTSSGLTASNVQDAIDELSASGSEHGIYELWSNPDITSSFAGQTVSITSTHVPALDSIIIVAEPYINESSAAQWNEFDTSIFNESPFTARDIIATVYTTAFHVSTRKVTNITVAGNTLSITFADGKLDGGSTDNTRAVPVRILGLIHND